MTMKLYLVHCGFYDLELSEGIYESHTNFFVAAENFETAKIKAREEPEFRKKKMHIDGLQEIKKVLGYEIQLIPTREDSPQTLLVTNRHHDL